MKATFKLQNPWRYNSNYSIQYHKRAILSELLKNWGPQKIIGLVGSRQVGKSSIIYLLIDHLIRKKIDPKNIFYFNLDAFPLHELFSKVADLVYFMGIKGGDTRKADTKYLFIDEIQRLKNPGLFLKELYDLHLNLVIVYSGSSQIEIKSKLKEHLVGRVRMYEIQRLSFEEYLEFRRPILKEQAFKDYLVYGSYPAVALADSDGERVLALRDIVQTYIQKDIIEFLHVEDPVAFNKLLVLLAHQIGNLLSLEKCAKTLQLPRKEIKKYLAILEQTFILKFIYPFYKNYSKEIRKSSKVYFLDLGLRNFLIKNFESVELRSYDNGALFENFYLLQLLNEDIYGLNSIRYWRTTNQTEIDFIIQSPKKTWAVETKWSESGKPKSFETLASYYPKIMPHVMTKEHYLKNT